MSHIRLNSMRLLTATLLLLLSISPSFAQGICDVKSFRLNSINGKVVSDGPKGHEPIAKAKIEVWRIGNENEDDKVVASTSEVW